MLTDCSAGLLTPLSIPVLMSSPLCLCGIFPIHLQRRAAEQKQSPHVTFVALPASGIYPPHSSIHLLNEPCHYSFPFLLLQLLSFNLVIDGAFGFLLHMRLVCMKKQVLRRFVPTKVLKVQLSHGNRPANIIILQPHKKRQMKL